MDISREEMITFIAMVDKRPVRDVEIIFIDMSAEQIKPMFEKMKSIREEMLREMNVMNVA